MKIFISCGEPSGDLHAASLIRALRRRIPSAEFVGFGGPRMAEAGGTLLYPLVDLAVMWIAHVLRNLHVFIGLLRRADRYFAEERPDAVVLIDYPGFNWQLARRAKAAGIPVFYFVPPQIWAWAGWRVEKVRKFVDHVLCALPFEADWYRERGVEGAHYIGHPYFDELATRVLDEQFLAEQRSRPGRVVALLPGSRMQEVERNFPMMIRAAAALAPRRSDARFVVACLDDRRLARCAELLAAEPAAAGLPIELYAARTPELIRLADVCWAVSGSVSLELMAEALPTVIVYKMGAAHLRLARKMLQVRYITLVNLLAGRELMPEYATSGDASAEMARHATDWLGDEAERRRVSDELAALRDRFAAPGATDRAAETIARLVAPAPTAPRGPHRPMRVPASRDDRLEHAG
ncbi:lipid-A-disaccharide synthase [Tautonia plasticadhaerens]|uniref:Lipid-A-disaccharide synthase n=1 Tax=Tautonia plasticadhaerens TaxID=2527974 RepID=A0A518HAF2_9BACT|nr:lipid-A-disaccharide synthase [Tautonia plasticadhaerens]QDV37835.1 Glycosyl transferase [Tautonia plasticadhaerens]